MGAEGDGRDHDGRPGGARVGLRGRVARPPRCLRTVEGWEVASLLVGPTAAPDGTGGAVGSGDAGEHDDAALLVTCSGVGASDGPARLAVGEEVVVLGRLASRRAARPEDDAVELAADAVLARPGTGTVARASAEPRIAP
jgi:hypothetical protein